MNYLAHLHLATIANEDPLYLVGGMMGDFVKGVVPAHYPEALIAGIRLHRRIDVYTDRHASVAEAKSLFQRPLRRYAGIVLDIMFDHFLTKRWPDYTDQSLSHFTEAAYATLQDHFKWLPVSLQAALPRMREHRILTSYETMSGVARSLDRVALRLSRGEPLSAAPELLELHYDTMELHFAGLYPDLLDFVSQESH